MKKNFASTRVFVFLIGITFAGFSLAAEKPSKLLETETYFEMESVTGPDLAGWQIHHIHARLGGQD